MGGGRSAGISGAFWVRGDRCCIIHGPFVCPSPWPGSIPIAPHCVPHGPTSPPLTACRTKRGSLSPNPCFGACLLSTKWCAILAAKNHTRRQVSVSRPLALKELVEQLRSCGSGLCVFALEYICGIPLKDRLSAPATWHSRWGRRETGVSDRRGRVQAGGGTREDQGGVIRLDLECRVGKVDDATRALYRQVLARPNPQFAPISDSDSHTGLLQ